MAKRSCRGACCSGVRRTRDVQRRTLHNPDWSAQFRQCHCGSPLNAGVPPSHGCDVGLREKVARSLEIAGVAAG